MEHRAKDFMVLANKSFAHFFKDFVPKLREYRRLNDDPDWPNWCYLPMAYTGQYCVKFNEDASVAAALLSALAAWRPTQGIYRFDPELYDALIDTPITGDMPNDVLYHLPEWGVYIETQDIRLFDEDVPGFFAFLQHDNGIDELRIMPDSGVPYHLPMELGRWSIKEGLSRSLERFGSLENGTEEENKALINEAADVLGRMLNLLIYICSQAEEISGTPSKPSPQRTKKGWREFPPSQPKVWDVGVRIGAALRAAYAEIEAGSGERKESVRPHMRRAHWHSFWTGPRNVPEQRKLIVKWLPPVAVNIEDGDTQLPAVIHKVSK